MKIQSFGLKQSICGVSFHFLVIGVLQIVQARNLLETKSAVCNASAMILRESSGSILSPNYPSNYPNNARCQWKIVSPANQSIELSFISFNLELSKSCKFDYVAIYDGEELYTGARYCGKITPTPFISNSSMILVEFKSDEAENNTGFSLRWKFRDRCLRDQFTCWNQACIPVSQQCDGVQNCEDNSDEIECAHGAGDSVECGKQMIAPQFTWDPRVLGGNEAVPGSWPWQAEVIQSSTGSIYCGGSVVHPRLIITASHCVDFVSRSTQIKVAVGRHRHVGLTGQVLAVRRVFKHPDYDSKTYNRDIALIELKSSITYTKTVRPVCLPPSKDEGYLPADGSLCIATGFGDLDPTQNGVISSNVLYQVRLPIINFDLCKRRYRITSAPIDFPTQLCAGIGSGDACQGDSGGPLVCLVGETVWYQIGITSYGIECNDPGFPGVYQKVSYHTSWVEQRMQWIDACTTGVSINEQTGYFNSPNYPDNYHDDSRCEWKILASPGQNLQIKFINVKLYGVCTSTKGDFLEIYDGNDLRYRLCGDTTPVDFTSTHENVTVTFTSDESDSSTGFSIRWNAITVKEKGLLKVSTIDIFAEVETTTAPRSSSYAQTALFSPFFLLLPCIFAL